MIALFLSLKNLIPKILLIILLLLEIAIIIFALIVSMQHNTPLYLNDHYPDGVNYYSGLLSQKDFWEVFPVLPPLWLPLFILAPIMLIKVIILFLGEKYDGIYVLHLLFRWIVNVFFILASINLIVHAVMMIFSDASKYNIQIFFYCIILILVPLATFSIYRQASKKSLFNRQKMIWHTSAFAWLAFACAFMSQITITNFNYTWLHPLPGIEKILHYTLICALLTVPELILWELLQPRIVKNPAFANG
jgi:hypothetical protein